MREEFDEEYYQRFYTSRETRVSNPTSAARTVEFAMSYLEWIRLDINSVLDVGCGMGWWGAALKGGHIKYTGMDISKWLCEEMGWENKSLSDPLLDDTIEPADLVVCQGVFPYVDGADVDICMTNLAILTKKALYFEATTIEDWRQAADREKSDDRVHLRSAEFYRGKLSKNFVGIGGGLFLNKDHAGRMLMLERTF